MLTKMKVKDRVGTDPGTVTTMDLGQSELWPPVASWPLPNEKIVLEQQTALL